MKKIPTGLPFIPSQYNMGSERTPVYYQHKYAVMNWLKELGKRESMIANTYLGKMRITRKILNDFLKYS